MRWALRVAAVPPLLAVGAYATLMLAAAADELLDKLGERSHPRDRPATHYLTCKCALCEAAR